MKGFQKFQRHYKQYNKECFLCYINSKFKANDLMKLDLSLVQFSLLFWGGKGIREYSGAQNQKIF